MRRVGIAAGAVAAVTLVLELVFHDEAHASFWWHRLPGFDLLYGLLGCAALTLFSKALGKAVVERAEDYWEER